MDFKTMLFRAYVKITKFQPKILTDEEKAELIPKMIKDNQEKDTDLNNVSQKITKGCSIQEIKLSNCRGWLFRRPDNQANKIIYYIHGGGFTGASTKERIDFVLYLVNKFGYNVFSIDYRLAPEFPFPHALDDCFQGYNYLLKTFSPNDIVFIGESAGGNLSIVLSMLIRDKGVAEPKSIYSNSAVTQLVNYTASYEEHSLKDDFIVVKGIIENLTGIYFKKEDAKNPYISPLYGDLSHLPPIVLTASKSECLYDDSVMLAQKLHKAGNKGSMIAYDGLCHAFIISPKMKKVVKKAYPDLKQYLKDNLG